MAYANNTTAQAYYHIINAFDLKLSKEGQNNVLNSAYSFLKGSDRGEIIHSYGAAGFETVQGEINRIEKFAARHELTLSK